MDGDTQVAKTASAGEAGAVQTDEAAPTGRSWLDRPLAGVFHISGEQAIYLLLLLAALAMRLWGLGNRAMSHDESLHALFSWKLYNGEGYVHDPMMHGPLLFEANALIYFLFGVSDFTARLVPALLGVAMVGMPYFFRRWLGRAGALTASLLILISPNYLYYSRYIRHDTYLLVETLLMVLALFNYVRTRQPKWLLLGATAVILGIATMEAVYIVGFIGFTFIVLAAVWDRLDQVNRRRLSLGLAGLGALLAVAISIWVSLSPPAATGQPSLAMKLMPTVMFVALVLLGAAGASLLLPRPGGAFADALRGVTWEALRLPLLVMLIIFVVLYTTFFTNLKGLISGSVGAVAYWLAQQGVQRGGQPWYYYIFLMPFYELVPFFIGIPSVFVIIYRAIARRPLSQPPSSGVGPDLGSYWLSFLVYWSIASFVIFSWAGEKMPWLIVHPTLPLTLLAAYVIGGWVERQDWRAWWASGGPQLSGLLLLMGMALLMLASQRPFAGMSLGQLQATGQWLGGLVIFVALAWFAAGYAQRQGYTGSLVSLKVLGIGLLAIFTLRFAWMASYVNYDYATEFLVYAHGTPDLKVVVRQLDEISRRTTDGPYLKFSYDQDDVWPAEWYFKDFPDRIFYGNEPTKQAMDAPVVIVNHTNEGKAKPFLGDRYYRFDYRLVWWPIEDYKGLTPAKILADLQNSKTLDKWANIWFYRRYPITFTDWPYQNRFAMYIRKDILNQMWDMGVTLALPSAMPTDPYQQVWKEMPASQIIGSAGAGPGQFNSPRGVAVGPDGSIYVVDSGNARVSVFDRDGKFVHSFGSAGTATGEFQEPWGIAVAQNGDVYVADTWNHRVQWFDSTGTFKGMWGYFADTQGNAQASPGAFWGPRSIAIDQQGFVYVTDTGNKRVQKFTPQGKFVAVFGSGGDGPGQFNEPVGIAIDPQGNFYVADTWNQRIEVFDSTFTYKAEWKLSTWQGQSLTNKPYLAADASYVYAVDPEGYRVLVFDKEGAIKLSFGRYGDDAAGMNLPAALALDSQGRLYVTDSQNNRLLRFDNPRP